MNFWSSFGGSGPWDCKVGGKLKKFLGQSTVNILLSEVGIKISCNTLFVIGLSSINFFSMGLNKSTACFK